MCNEIWLALLDDPVNVWLVRFRPIGCVRAKSACDFSCCPVRDTSSRGLSVDLGAANGEAREREE